ncbi:anti-repressor SinI family protein [Bacillus sp. DTU_2020_1000418_1_SI_GHA_SEK_038]|nr:anti-repressor SinI family protein [Bacillus sp. DTU_2020_1000418_1_SI_GHA_SEK_038]WNS75739.1 anti-repressor SinI family protein [Bacillus sp. DTU_2020_1000418_1_SI_GHA_SEK_038]
MKGELDKEWKALILEAKKIGITIEEVRHYLQQIKKTTKTGK